MIDIEKKHFILNQMVNYQSIPHEEHLNLLFHSFADPTRRQIMERLLQKDLTINEIAQPYDMSLPAVSKHLKILEKAQLIIRQKKGREHTIHINPATFTTLSEYITFYTTFWNSQFERLEQFLKKKGGEQTDGRT